MSSPSPFDIGRAVGSSISGAFKKHRDTTAIDDILGQAYASEDPQQIDFAMRQILSKVAPERQGMALQVLQSKAAQIESQHQAQRKSQAYSDIGLPPSISNLPESIQKEFIKSKTTAPRKAFTPGEASIEKQAAEELFKAPQEQFNLQESIKDIQKLKELSSRAYLPGVGSLDDRNQFNALRNKIAREKGRDLKGVLSDKDLAFLLGETGDFGSFGSQEILDRSAKAIESQLQNKKKRYDELSQRFPHLSQAINAAAPPQQPQAAPQNIPQIAPGHTLMHDNAGNPYSIPNDLIPQAKAQGLL